MKMVLAWESGFKFTLSTRPTNHLNAQIDWRSYQIGRNHIIESKMLNRGKIRFIFLKKGKLESCKPEAEARNVGAHIKGFLRVEIYEGSDFFDGAGVVVHGYEV